MLFENPTDWIAPKIYGALGTWPVGCMVFSGVRHQARIFLFCDFGFAAADKAESIFRIRVDFGNDPLVIARVPPSTTSRPQQKVDNPVRSPIPSR